MNVHLHIERLSIQIPGVTRSQRQLVSAAIEQELTRLLASGELAFTSQETSSGALQPRAPGLPEAASRLTLGHDHGPSALGVEIAKAVYGRVAAAVPNDSKAQRKRPHAAPGKGAGR